MPRGAPLRSTRNSIESGCATPTDVCLPHHAPKHPSASDYCKLVPHLDRRVSGAARRTTMSRICCSVTACERFFITRLVRSSSNPAP